MRLVEFFIFEDTGRDLHDFLDVIMDTAQEGRPYERELRQLRARILTVAATGDVIDPSHLDSNKLRAQIDIHGRSGPVSAGFGSAMWDFDRKDYSQRSNGTGGTWKDGGRGKFVHPIRYGGRVWEPAQLIGHWRQQAHTELDQAIFTTPTYGTKRAPEDKFEDIEDAVDQIAKIAKTPSAPSRDTKYTGDE